MILSDEEHFTIVLSAVRDYQEGKNDIPILIVEKVTNQIKESLNKQIDTQDIYDEIVEVFDYYNDFIDKKGVDLKKIQDDFYEVTKEYLNQIVEEIG